MTIKFAVPSVLTRLHQRGIRSAEDYDLERAGDGP